MIFFLIFFLTFLRDCEREMGEMVTGGGNLDMVANEIIDSKKKRNGRNGIRSGNEGQ